MHLLLDLNLDKEYGKPEEWIVATSDFHGIYVGPSTGRSRTHMPYGLRLA